MTTPQFKTPCTGAHEIYNFGRLFLWSSLLIDTLSLSEPCPRVEKNFFLKTIDFTLLPQNYLPLE